MFVCVCVCVCERERERERERNKECVCMRTCVYVFKEKQEGICDFGDGFQTLR